MLQYWTEEDIAALDAATKFGQLVDVAYHVIARMAKPVGMVCGPLTTGGMGNTEANMAHFGHAIAYLRRKGFSVFSQLPFQQAMSEIKNSMREGAVEALLNEFYLPLLQLNLLSYLVFLPGWQESVGASWEREKALEFGIPILDLPESWCR